MENKRLIMRRLSGDTWLAIGLVAVLVVITVIAVIWQSHKQAPPALSSASTEPDGACALHLWLEAKGYRISTSSEPGFRLPADADLAFVLEPFYDSDETHWQLLDAWVESGGTLIGAGEGWGAGEIFLHYELDTVGWWQGRDVTAQSPLLASPPLVDFNHLELLSAFSTDRDDLIVLLASEGDPVMVTFRMGSGRVILASFIHPFTNAGLKEPGNPELVLNFLALAWPRQTIWFDEWHHGANQQMKIVGPQDWLHYTPAGHALLFIAAILFLALLLQGRPFGRPVPLPHQLTRRAPLEYITALANLNRRAGHRSQVMQQYHQSLKYHLARRYRLNPILPDDAYVNQLVGFRTDLNAVDLRNLLNRLSKRSISEGEMVKLVAETAEWLKDNLL
jgi:hypothetical protein